MSLVQNIMTKGKILSLSSNSDVYRRGEKYYKDGKILSYDTDENKDGLTIVRTSIEGNYKNYEVMLKLDSIDTLSSYSCSCASHNIWCGACKHVVATLLAYISGHSPKFSAEQMRQHVHTLTHDLEKLIYDGVNDSLLLPAMVTTGDGLLKLLPTLNRFSKKDFALTFTVGAGRMYVVKNISTFVNSMKKGETVTYGQDFKIKLKKEMFDEPSQKLIDFVIYENDIHLEISKKLSRQFQTIHNTLVGKELQLTPRNVDDFFSIFEDRTIESSCEYGSYIELVHGYPKLNIGIRYEKNVTIISEELLPQTILPGVNYSYILTNGYLYRMPKSDGALINLLLKSIDETGGSEVLLSGNDEERFNAIVVPQLKRMNVISSISGKRSNGESYKVNAKIYFDTIGKDITGKIDFHYGDFVFGAFIAQSDNSKITRDIIAEYTLCRRMASYGFYEDKKNKVYRLSGNDIIFSFLYEKTGIESFKMFADVYVSDDLQKKTTQFATPKLGLRLSGGLLKMTLDGAGYNIGELVEILEAYRTKKKFHRLKDGRFLSLGDISVSATAEFLEALDVSRKEVRGKTLTIPSYRALYVDELTNNETLSATYTIKRDSSFKNLISSFKNNEGINFKVPSELNNILREYQKVGFSWLKTLAHFGFGGILADDMGLGKTLQIITLLMSEQKCEIPSIVVTPTSLLYNWENEILKFAPGLSAQVVTGLPEKRRELLKSPNVDIYITTYDMLKRDSESYKDMEFLYIIADEAQNIKNPTTQTAKTIKELNGRVRFALTGTPIENTLTELWSIFDFIMPGYLYSAHKFGKVYETPIIKYNNKTVASKLRKQIAPFVLRRIKENVLKELPEKTETTLQAEFSDEQKKIYQANLLEAIGAFDDIISSDSFADNRMKILARLTKLRQICCHPSLFLEDYNGGSGKLALALETVQLSLDSGHRVLLFSQFTSMLKLIQKEILRTGITTQNGKHVRHFYLDGNIKAKERMEMTERFNAGERDLFLISLKAGGTGLNLTGADVVIHFDPWWNPSVMDQAADRAHRYGQKKVVQVFNIVAKDSIEEKIMALQEKKRGLIDSVITEGGSFVNLLSEDEVRKLFL